MDTLEALAVNIPRDYLARARELRAIVAAGGDEAERRREVTPEVVHALIEGGIFKMLLPKSLGGAELDPLTYTAVLEELARGEHRPGAHLLALLRANRGRRALLDDLLVPALHRAFALEQMHHMAVRVRQHLDLDVTGVGSPGAGIRHRNRHATRLGCRVAVAEPDGSPRVLPHGRQQIRTMLFPKSEARIIDNWYVLGLRGTGSDSYALEDHFVPQRYTAGRDNEEELREKGPLYKFTSGMIYAMSFSHVSMGIARGAYDAFIEIARDKVPRGAKGTLRENNVIQSQIAQCEARLKSARAYLRGVIGEMWEEAQRDNRISPDQHPQLRLAATWAIHQARDVVATVYHAAGASAIFEANPLERRMRDIHAGTQQGQGRAVHFETVGQMLMGLPPEGRMFR